MGSQPRRPTDPHGKRGKSAEIKAQDRLGDVDRSGVWLPKTHPAVPLLGRVNLSLALVAVVADPLLVSLPDDQILAEAATPRPPHSSTLSQHSLPSQAASARS
jgi:hypothetical protein